jgi:hypothetical protein
MKFCKEVLNGRLEDGPDTAFGAKISIGQKSIP